MEVRVLGELEVVGPGGVAIDVAGSRLRRLVTRLAVDAGHVVTSAELVDAVWGEDPPADPVGALQTLVSRLRRALGNPAVVQQSHQGYRLTVASDAVDAERFRRLARRGRDLLAAGDAATARSTLAEALDLWRGPALADADDGEYAVALAARLDEERLDALAARVDADLALGHAADVVAELEDRIRANPLREQLTGQLMRALAATGRPAEALAAYERLRSTLADTLGTDPSPALRELHLALLREDVPGAQPPIGRRPGLRAGLTSFLGREAETERVVGVLTGSRLATVVGPGGAGKTRLATEVGRAWQAAHGGGASLVELAPVRDENGVLPAFLAALDLREAIVLERTREARRGTDDFSLLVATSAPGRTCSSSTTASTCSTPPRGSSRTSWRPAPRCGCWPPAANRWGSTGSRSASCRRSGSRRGRSGSTRPCRMRRCSSSSTVPPRSAPGWSLDESTLAPVVEIVRRLDGLPLAIELAAARTRVLPVSEVAKRLSDRFRLLTGGRRTALPRHQTLRAVVEWSWDLLTADERLLAERLAVFPAGSTTESATAVCADERLDAADVPTLLGSLVDKSLLTVDESHGLRYRMLETIREFGIDRLAERRDVDEARLRHATFFADLVSLQSRRLYDAQQLDAARVLDVEHDNILSAVRYLGDSEDAARTMRMVLELSWYWSLVGAHAEAWTWLGYALAVPGEAAPGARELARVVMLMTRGMEDNTAFEEDMTLKAAALQQELELLPDPDYALPQAVVLRAMLAYFAGSPEVAEQKRLAGVEHPDPWVRAVMLMLGAAMAENFGHVDVTRANVDTAFEEFTALGDRWGLATVVAMKAQLQTYDGDLEGAIASYAEAEEYLRALGAHSDEAFMAMRLANLRASAGRPRRGPARDRAVRRARGRQRVPADPRQRGSRVDRGARGRHGQGRRDPRHDDRPGGEQPSPRRSARPGPARHHGGAARRRARRPRRGEQERERRVHRGAGDEGHADPRGQRHRHGRRLALAYDRCEDAAELLGAAARVRGIGTHRPHHRRAVRRPPDAGWARRRSPPHTNGAGRCPRRTRRSGSTPRHWT